MHMALATLKSIFSVWFSLLSSRSMTIYILESPTYITGFSQHYIRLNSAFCHPHFVLMFCFSLFIELPHASAGQINNLRVILSTLPPLAPTSCDVNSPPFKASYLCCWWNIFSGCPSFSLKCFHLCISLLCSLLFTWLFFTHL